MLAELERELRDSGLTAGEANLLAAFEGAAARSLTELGRATGDRRSTLTGIVDRLERRGLAERTINPDDRRTFVIALTPRGRRAAQRVTQAFALVEGRLHRRLPASQLAQFRRSLAALADGGG